jgi:hypothetical protein
VFLFAAQPRHSSYSINSSSTMGEHLVLDPAIRNWCLFPLMIVMILVSVLKHYINVLLQSDKPADVEDLRLK